MSNLENNFNSFQLQLPLDISTIIPKDDLVYTFVEISEGVDLTKYLTSYLPHSNQKHSLAALLKTVLFGFVDNRRTLRQVEHVCKVDIRYMWLSQKSMPSFMTVQRFVKNCITLTVKDIFYDINKYLIEKDSIDMTKLFIDGTKIEAYARKTSFVWKKAVLKYQKKTVFKDNRYISCHELDDTGS